MNIKKTIKIILSVIIILIIMIITLYFIKSKNYAKTDETKNLKEKISQEIHFLDDYLISIANSANNINLENYIVKAETIIGQSSKESTNSQSSGQGGQGSSGGENSDGSEGNSKTSASSSGSNSSVGSSTISAYIVEPSDVLVNNRNSDWKTMKIAAERLYSVWNTIAIDLYKIDANATDIQNFGSDLDELVKNIKSENKTNTLSYIAKLYNHLNSFGIQVFNNNMENKMISTKSNILNAYSLIEDNKWDEIRKYLQKAEDEYMNIMNNENNKNQYNINKAYVMIKEFQSSVNGKDTDVLYIKYKNLLNELNVISI